MIPALQFDDWQWFVPRPVGAGRCVGGRPFPRPPGASLRHRWVAMDTLISIGALAAFGWSLYALFLGDAGETGMRMSADVGLARQEGSSEMPAGRWPTAEPPTSIP